jgi:hypothetical protein
MIKDKLGVNCFGWDLGSHPDQANKDARTASLQAGIINTRFTWLRIYADASVYKDANNTTYKFNPDGRGYLTEDYIAQIRANLPTLKVNFCFQNAPQNIINEWAATGARNTQYRHPGTNVSDPNTWNEFTNDLKVVAGRTGTNANVPNYPVYQSPNSWEPVQIMKKGANINNQIEGGNEYDNGYSNNPMTGPEGGLVNPDLPAISGSQYAVLWKKYGDAIKAIDPNLQVSTTGVMTSNPQILSDALAWFNTNNAGKVPFDVYQFHCYPWGWPHGNIASGMPPEISLIPDAKAIVQTANGKCKVCVGEWGWDIHPDSNIGIRPFGGYTAEQIRAYWVMRTLLGFEAVGVYQAFYYKERQDYGPINDTNSEQFITSNLFADNGDDIHITRRFTGDMFRQISDYGDFVIDSILVNDGTKVVYRFKNGNQYLYFGATVEILTPVLVNGVTRASFTERKVNYTFPAGTRLDIQPGNTFASQAFAGGSIELSTKPVFVLTGEGSTPIPPQPEPQPPTKVLFHRGYFSQTSGKRFFFIQYTDYSFVATDGRYRPLVPQPVLKP